MRGIYWTVFLIAVVLGGIGWLSHHWINVIGQ
jgi:hypothetical protein